MQRLDTMLVQAYIYVTGVFVCNKFYNLLKSVIYIIFFSLNTHPKINLTDCMDVIDFKFSSIKNMRMVDKI